MEESHPPLVMGFCNTLFSIPSEALGYSFQEHEKRERGSVIHLWRFWEELQELGNKMYLAALSERQRVCSVIKSGK